MDMSQGVTFWLHLVMYLGLQGRGGGNQGGPAWGVWSYQTLLGDGLGWFMHAESNGGISRGSPEQTGWSDIWCLPVLWNHWKFRVACYRQHLCRSGMSGEVYEAKPVLKGTRTKRKPVSCGKLLQFLGSGVRNFIKSHLIVGKSLIWKQKERTHL